MKRLAIAALTLFGLITSSIHGQVAQPKGQDVAEDVLSRQVEFTELNWAEVAEAFAFSLSDARVPGGVVKIKGCNTVSMPQHWPVRISTLRDRLDFIVQSEPDYEWSMNHGVVNLMPKSKEPGLLQTRISSLKMKDAESIYLPLDKLMSLPEVRQSIAQLGLSQAVKFSLIPFSLRSDKPRYSVDCHDVTIKEALDAIVRAHGRNVWRYEENRCNGKTEYSIDFVVDAA